MKAETKIRPLAPLYSCAFILYKNLSYDLASGSEITPCNKIDKPLVFTDFRETL